MKLINITALSLILGSSMANADECVNPDAPGIPEGASSSMEQMVAGQKAVKAFQATNIEYMSCLEARINEADAKAANSSGADKEASQKLSTEISDAYNQAVSAEESVAGAFNAAIRDYKAANPK